MTEQAEGTSTAAKPSIAVLMTCFNRREQTLCCLDRLTAQTGSDAYALTVILVDDRSTDGTAEAVRERFPAVNLLAGTGSLYWNRGMHMAFAHALERGFDFYLWLNDDTLLSSRALRTLLETAAALAEQRGPCVVTGSTYDKASGRRSYGGLQWSSGIRRRLIPVEPALEGAVPCVTFNGNCTLIPHAIAAATGNLDPAFHHSFGDFDYGFRVAANGFAAFVMPGYAGSCSDNSRAGTWRDRSASFKRRWQQLNSPKGSPFAQWSLYCRRHLGPMWPLYAVSPYLKTVVTSVVRRSHGAAQP